MNTMTMFVVVTYGSRKVEGKVDFNVYAYACISHIQALALFLEN